MTDNGTGKRLYKFGDFILDPDKRRLEDSSGSPIPLTSKVFDTLLHLLENRVRIIDKEELMSAIWPDTIVEENNLSQNISALRRVLGEQPGDHRFIVTVPGTGFRFVADVREVSAAGQNEADTEMLTELPVTSTQRSGRTSKARMRLALLGSAVVVALLAGIGYFGINSLGDDAVPGAPITSVAVLPFVNADDDRDLDYFSDGISESLIDRLSELPHLHVTARNSSFQYRGANIDLADAANKLSVQAIVTGRVTRRGEVISIRAELTDTRTDKQIWGSQFERKNADVLSIQREIVHAVAEKLRLKLSPAQDRQLTQEYSTDPAAYEMLLRGRFERNDGNQDAHQRSIQYFQNAIAIDPKYAIAFAELSLSYSIGVAVPDPRDYMPKAEAAAKTALQLDDSLAEAHHAMAMFNLNSWDWAGAENEYLRSIELNPSLSRAYAGYANYLNTIGRHDQAVIESRKARDLDPLTQRSNTQLAWSLMLAGQIDEAIRIFKEYELHRHNNLGFAYLRKGLYKESAAEFGANIDYFGTGTSRLIYLAAAHAKAGDTKKSQDILQHIERSENYVSPAELAGLYVTLGQNERAFTLLEKAYDEHDLQLQNLKIESLYDGIKDDPRFTQLMSRIGLP